MKKRCHTPEQVIRKLAEGDKLLNQSEDLTKVCRQLEIAESTWRNGPIESWNSRLRYEILNGHLLEPLLEAQVLLEDWRHEYNHDRLRRSLCYLTPVEFKELWMKQCEERLSLEVAHPTGSPHGTTT